MRGEGTFSEFPAPALLAVQLVRGGFGVLRPACCVRVWAGPSEPPEPPARRPPPPPAGGPRRGRAIKFKPLNPPSTKNFSLKTEL
jgi:hypothetical protein